MELTELFGPCVYLDPVEDTDGFEPWAGVAGEEAVEDPNSRRVDENNLEGSRREDEYWEKLLRNILRCQYTSTLTFSFQSTTHFSIHGTRLIVTNSRTKRPICRMSS